MRRHTGSRTVSAASFTNRSGLSLLEIIISVAIFMASLAAIMEGLLKDLPALLRDAEFHLHADVRLDHGLHDEG